MTMIRMFVFLVSSCQESAALDEALASRLHRSSGFRLQSAVFQVGSLMSCLRVSRLMT